MSASNFLLSSLISSMSLLLQHLSRGSVNVPELQAEVTSAREVATAAEAIYVTRYLLQRLLVRRPLRHGIVPQFLSRVWRTGMP
jgi:hypothetical protein